VSEHPKKPATIWTIGHSTRLLEEFLNLLAQHRIEALADVRSFPGSRRYPQYDKEQLAKSLSEHGIAYHWVRALGGRRPVSPQSPNTGWRNASFRGYADYMGSSEFARGLGELIDLGSQVRTAVMCAEALWWRCHRSLIADALCVRGIEVVHIMDAKHSIVHPMTAPARIIGGALSYAAAARE
jgi:uncharacterized protein (DUF488 family)